MLQGIGVSYWDAGAPAADRLLGGHSGGNQMVPGTLRYAALVKPRAG
jgi:hypothetical protein